MPQAPYLVFKPPPTSQDSSASADTYVFDVGQTPTTTAILTADSNWTAGNTTVNTPAQVYPSGLRNTFQIRPAADAANPIYVGIDNTVSVATGAIVSPGAKFSVGGYTGPVWVIGPPGVSAPYFYRTT